MKWIALVLLTLFPIASSAESYTLIFESKCSSTGERLEFSCKREPTFSGQDLGIFRNGEKWYGKEILKTLKGSKENVFPLELIKQDVSVMVFNYPVLYSGIATIVLIKKTGRFYFSEISYSEALYAQGATIEDGRFTVGK
ncbi:MAG: hypothetical protein Q8K18_03205 [Burkholderiales bacterium]|nr:hypothetical protein [Burkholderiales bacterium]